VFVLSTDRLTTNRATAPLLASLSLASISLPLHDTHTSLHSYRSPPRLHSCRPRDIRVRLPPELPKRADATPQVLGKERSEAIALERHILERELNQWKIVLLLQVPERRQTSARCTKLGQNEIRSRVGRRGPANTAKHRR